MDRSVIIPSRFNGPPDSGNGGYSCGVLAAFIDGPARVRLHVPPPLDKSATWFYRDCKVPSVPTKCGPFCKRLAKVTTPSMIWNCP